MSSPAALLTVLASLDADLLSLLPRTVEALFAVGLAAGCGTVAAASASLFVVDPHPIARRGFRSLAAQLTDVRIVGEAGEATDAFETITEQRPDLVVTDLSVPGMGGLSLIERLAAYDADLLLLAMSDRPSALYGERALRAGARGYVRKSQPTVAVAEAIRTLLGGDYYLPPDVQNLVVRRSTRRSAPEADGPAGVEALSTRELEVFEQIGRGRTTAEIADNLNISPKTVHSHRRSAQERVGASTPQELTYLAVRWVHDC
jgi:DNA-binding NarL/FixJ family response regulator